jgi:SpoIID/LytB domain protein
VGTDGRRRLRPALAWAAVAVLMACGLVQTATTTPAEATTASSFQLTGHGYGHGRGLGQWGSYGYATQYGWSYQQIVSRYYGGTTLKTGANDVITVRLAAQDGRDLVMTSGERFYVGGVQIDGGTAARVSVQSDGSFLLSTSYGCASPVVWTTVIPDSRAVSSVYPGDDVNSMISVCNDTGTKQYRGELSLLSTSGQLRTINTVRMEDYLRGVIPRESPASWADAASGKGIEALKAQAVAARSYAYSERRDAAFKTCDTTSCQVYGGAGTNLARIEDPRSDAAVAATANQVLTSATGAVVRAEFSSSTGGYTAGGTFPAVPDDGDAASPYHTWTTTVSSAEVAADFGVGQLVDFVVQSRNGLGADGGRVQQVKIVGTQKTVVVSGDDVRTALNLRSNWFSVTSPLLVQPTVYEADAGGGVLRQVPMGDPGDVVVACDWNGDGVDTLGVFRRGVYYLSNQVDGGGPYATVPFGNAGDQPVCGDWNGDGVDTIGVYRSGVAYFRNSNTTGGVDGQLAFGNPGDVAVVGNWNGDAYDTLGVRRSDRFYVVNSNLSAAGWQSFVFGNAGDTVVAGDWNGDGTDTVGVRRGDTFFLRGEGVASAGYSTSVFGLSGDLPLAGHWSGAGPDTVGVNRP